MAHGRKAGRKFRPPRRLPDSERSLFEQKLNGRYSRTLDRVDLLNMIRGGEDTYIEFKIRLVNIEKVTAEIVALANAGGGAIVFGVNDHRRLEGVDDPEAVENALIDICRNSIKPALLPKIDKVSFDNGVRVVVLQVDDSRAPYSGPDNRYYVRVGSTKREADGGEMAELFARSRTAYFEDLPLHTVRVDELDEALIWSYVRDIEGGSFDSSLGFPTPQVLSDLMLAIDYGGRLLPTMAACLLFGTEPAVERAVPQCALTVIRYSGTNRDAPIVERAVFYGNLGALFDRASSFLKRYINLCDTRPARTVLSRGSDNEPVPARANYSREAVVEALYNLLAHRNYSAIGQNSQVLIFDDRLEFANPTRQPDLSKKTLEYGAAPRPNPRLHHVLTSREYGASPGIGLPAVRRAQIAFSKREPRISVVGEEFRLELPGI